MVRRADHSASEPMREVVFEDNLRWIAAAVARMGLLLRYVPLIMANSISCNFFNSSSPSAYSNTSMYKKNTDLIFCTSV